MKALDQGNRHELKTLHKLPRYALGEKEMMCRTKERRQFRIESKTTIRKGCAVDAEGKSRSYSTSASP
jgi:hypothetical protein